VHALGKEPTRAAWEGADVAKACFGVDMHNEGQNMLPGAAVTIAAAAAGIHGAQWVATAHGLLQAGAPGEEGFRVHCTALLWQVWSGTNVRRPGRLTSKLTQSMLDAGEELVRAFEPQARQCIRHNVFAGSG
jgi:hypothetical protein